MVPETQLPSDASFSLKFALDYYQLNNIVILSLIQWNTSIVQSSKRTFSNHFLPISGLSSPFSLNNGDLGKDLVLAACEEYIRSALRTVETLGERIGKFSIWVSDSALRSPMVRIFCARTKWLIPRENVNEGKTFSIGAVQLTNSGNTAFLISGVARLYK